MGLLFEVIREDWYSILMSGVKGYIVCLILRAVGIL